MVARPHRFRFGLRTLLLATLVFGAALGWWFRPLTIAKRWPNGQLQYELHARRAWNGALATNGQQRWWWANGQLAREGESYGAGPPTGLTAVLVGQRFADVALAHERRWNSQGEPLPAVGPFWIDWYVLCALEESEAPPVVDWSVYRFAETEH